MEVYALFGGLLLVNALVFWAMWGAPDRARRPVLVMSGGWQEPDNDGKDDWKPDDDEDPSGAPGYYLPPGPRAGWPKYLRPFFATDGATEILNGCPRCGGTVQYRRRDGARWCSQCQRCYYPMSEDSIIRHPPDTAT